MTTVERRQFSLPLASPFHSAGETIEKRRGVAVRIRDGSHAGVGEATPLPGWTESFDDCRANLDAAIEQDGSIRRLPESPAARHAVQLARLDLAARRAASSLAGYCSPRDVLASIPCQATIGNDEREETVAAAQRAVDDGAAVLKCKVGGRPVPAEEARLRAVRDAVGEDIDLRLDANRAWSHVEAERIWPILADLAVAYVEEPLVQPTPDAFESLGAGVGIAIDETVHEQSGPIDDWFPVVEAVILKPMALGGIDRALACGMAAHRHGVRPVVSGTIDGVIARTAGVHLAAILPETTAVGLGTASFLATDLGPDPAPVAAGSMRVPEGPGLGTHGPWGDEG